MNIEQIDIGDDELAEIGAILKSSRNFSMSGYKDKCMKRRVAIRMRSTQCYDAPAYCTLLKLNESEIDRLKKVLTIHVSQFYRNPSMFEKLRCDILPDLYQVCAEKGTPLRIWSLGCASGEEAYSLAILLQEYFARDLRRTSTSIDATDIDEDTLDSARKAEFNEERLKELPDGFLGRYFHQSGQKLQLSEVTRRMVTFHKGDIAEVEKYLPCNLALCRNTLIYFTRPEQEKILNGLADVLPVGGILVLGKSEALMGGVRRRFTVVCPVERIYRRI